MSYFLFFGTQYVTDRVAMYMHAYTLYSAVRPFGCSVVMGTYDVGQKKPEMYMIDPSGVYHVSIFKDVVTSPKLQVL